MSTKPNQPKEAPDWIDYGSKLLKLAEEAYEKGTVKKKVVKQLEIKLNVLASLSYGEQSRLCKIPAKRIERHVIEGLASEPEQLIYELNELGMNKFSSLWKQFGRQIASAKYVENFYPIKVKREQRQSFEDACLFYLDNNERSLKDKYRHTYSVELDVDGLRSWLNEDIEERKGKHKHLYDAELMYILAEALW